MRLGRGVMAAHECDECGHIGLAAATWPDGTAECANCTYIRPQTDALLGALNELLMRPLPGNQKLHRALTRVLRASATDCTCSCCVDWQAEVRAIVADAIGAGDALTTDRETEDE